MIHKMAVTPTSEKAGWSTGQKIGIVIAVFVVIGTLNRQSNPTATLTSTSSVSTEASGSTHDVNKAAFQSLKTGMSYRQAVAILGSEGEEISSNEIGGAKTVMYKWEGGGFGANMNAMFQNDKLISKAQMGLK